MRKQVDLAEGSEEYELGSLGDIEKDEQILAQDSEKNESDSAGVTRESESAKEETDPRVQKVVGSRSQAMRDMI